MPLFERACLYLAAAGVDLLEERTVETFEPEQLDGFVGPFDAERVRRLTNLGYRAAPRR